MEPPQYPLPVQEQGWRQDLLSLPYLLWNQQISGFTLAFFLFSFSGGEDVGVVAVSLYLGHEVVEVRLGQHGVRKGGELVHFWFTSWALVMGGILERSWYLAQ